MNAPLCAAAYVKALDLSDQDGVLKLSRVALYLGTIESPSVVMHSALLFVCLLRLCLPT